MVKELELTLKKITKESTSEGDIFKVILKADEFDDTDIQLNLRLTFRREIPKSWWDVLGGNIDDTVKIVLGAKKQQTKLEV